MPELWTEVNAKSWQVQSRIVIPGRDIRGAFSRLMRDRTLYDYRCFCFFIDGLDEY